MKNKGLFISLEGIEATGKSTIAEKVKSTLKDRVVVTREPGGIKASEEIRETIMNNDISDRTELLLFLASRKEHLDKRIIPELEKGKIVICDRYAHSSFAYQGYGRGLNLEEIKQLNDFVTENMYPDITFLIDIDVKTSMKRKSKVDEQNRFDKETFDFFQKVRSGYLDMSKKPLGYGNICVIDGEKSIDEIVEKILNILEEYV